MVNMQNRKGVVEVQFNWVFIIIIGAVILAFFVSMSMKQKGISEEKKDYKIKLDVHDKRNKLNDLTNKEWMVTSKSVWISKPGPRDELKFQHPATFAESDITKLNLKAAYQRNCSNRYVPETDEILDNICKLIGVERVARKFDRENGICCASPFAQRGHKKLARETHYPTGKK